MGFIRYVRMQRPLYVHFLSSLCATFYDLQIPCDCSSLLIIHLPSFLVANPSVSATTTRVNPQDMLESKIISQSYIDYLDSHCDELPALNTDICLIAACSNIIVICQIDIKAQFFGKWFERGSFPKRFSIAWVCGIHWSDFETRRHESKDIFAQSF